jgi:hypothetical protein
MLITSLQTCCAQGNSYFAIASAVEHQHAACAELLLKAGADVNAAATVDGCYFSVGY